MLAAPTAADCPTERIDRRAEVAFVNDGDTLRLTDGTRVRLVGVNTPEIGREGAPDQPFARAARRALIGWLDAADRRVRLRYAHERRDDYGRLLAHAYLPDGTSITRRLLRRGYGLQITVPPNTWSWRCYVRAERVAREAGRRVWTVDRFRGLPASALPPDAAGFYHVTGSIRRVGESRRAWWLELDGLTLRLPKADVPRFAGAERSRLDRAALGRAHREQGDLLARRLAVRGWIYRVRGQARMNLRHPAALLWRAPADARSE